MTDAANSPAPQPPAPLPTSMIFIDGTNFDWACLGRFSSNRIDYSKLIPLVGAGTKILHTFYVTAPYKRQFDEEMYRVQTGTLGQLKKLPNVTVDLQQHRSRQTQCKRCKQWSTVLKEKGTDVAVASLLVEAAVSRAADRLILVANDSDYGPAIKIASERHQRHCTLAYAFGPDDSDHKIRVALSPMIFSCKSFVKINLPMLSACWLR